MRTRPPVKLDVEIEDAAEVECAAEVERAPRSSVAGVERAEVELAAAEVELAAEIERAADSHRRLLLLGGPLAVAARRPSNAHPARCEPRARARVRPPSTLSLGCERWC